MKHDLRPTIRLSAFRLPALLLLAALPLATPAQAPPAPAPKRPITHEDLTAFQRLGATAVSPDGRWIVVAVTEPAYEEDARRSDLWIVPADGSKPPRALTAGKGGEGDPAWSPDGTRLAFTAKREGDELSQVYVLPIEGGEARRVSNASGGASTPVWSPDGRALLYTSFVYPEAKDEEDNKRIVAERKARKYNLRAYDGFPIRHWDRWLDERRPTLMLQSLDGGSAPRDLLAGTALRRGAGFGGRLGNEGESIHAAFTPDGRELVFTASSNRSSAAREEIVQSLWLVPVAGGEPRRLTDMSGDYAAPQFTPDGATLLAHREAAGGRWVFNRTQLVAWSWPIVGKEREVAQDFDLSVGDFVIAPDSRTAWFAAEHHGHDRLYRVPLAGGKPAQSGEMPTGGVSRLAVGGTAEAPVLAGLWGSATNPAELVRIDPASGARTALTSFNTARLAELDLVPVEEFWFEAKTGARVHNVLIKPPGFDPGRKYPLFVLIHGGPHGMWKDEISYRWNYHLLGSPGYVVLASNYSGSTGFGEAFARRIQGDPLKGPAEEINQAADEAIKRYSYIDRSRQAAGGASYGGHLTNWLAVSTDRYKALVSHAGLYDLRSQWTTSDVAYSRERNLGGPAWRDDLKVWREQSPFYRSEKLKTPILLTFGEKDYRVPVNNAFEFWAVLQRQGVPSRLVVFPDENHWILKPENSRQHYREILDWLKKYL